MTGVYTRVGEGSCTTTPGVCLTEPAYAIVDHTLTFVILADGQRLTEGSIWELGDASEGATVTLQGTVVTANEVPSELSAKTWFWEIEAESLEGTP